MLISPASYIPREVRTTTEEEIDLENIELNGGEEAGEVKPS
jgi:hypothetical protein